MADFSKINNSSKKRILVVPLDWGLGHATRCVPIIRVLRAKGHEVFVGAEAGIANLIEAEFPGITILPLRGYRVRYSRSKWTFGLNILMQIPGILRTIRNERTWLREVVKKYDIDGVISDNRFGLSNPKTPTAFMTHQLAPKTGFSWLDGLARKINYRYINRFRICWVPDAEGAFNFAGDLSHPEAMPNIPVKYLGILSRLTPEKTNIKYDLCVLLSGPEPQRSMLEEKIISQLINLSIKVVVVRGLPGNELLPSINNDNITVHNHLPSPALNQLLNESAVIVSRTGYSSVMDLAILEKKAILIPTPGQPEQIHIANHLHNNPQFIITTQNDLRLEKNLEALKLHNIMRQGINQWNQSIVSDWASSL